MSYNYTSYLGKVYDTFTFSSTVDQVKTIILENKIEFDAIAFRGTSGSALAFPLAYLLNKSMICIRKSKGHHFEIYEGIVGIKKYIIVDDFVDTGNTLKKIESSIRCRHEKDDFKVPKCSAIILYDEAQFPVSSQKTDSIVKKIFKNQVKIFLL